MKKYFFVRRYVELDSKMGSFTILKDELMEVNGATYDVALKLLLDEIDSIEGSRTKIPNGGYPLGVKTHRDRAIYHSYHALCALSDEAFDLNEIDDELTNNLYQGFYSDPNLKHGHGLTIEDMRIDGNILRYIFYTEGGRFNGDEHRYMYLDNVLYKREEIDTVKPWHFETNEEIVTVTNPKDPFIFSGRLLSFAYHKTGGAEKEEYYFVKVFRDDENLVFHLWVDFYDLEGNPNVQYRGYSTHCSCLFP